MQKELEELLNNLNINNSWSSDSTKISCLAHVIQLVVKAILGVFNVKLAKRSRLMMILVVGVCTVRSQM